MQVLRGTHAIYHIRLLFAIDRGGGFYIYLTDGPNIAEKRLRVRDRRFGVDWIYEVAKGIAEKMA